jgi:hypothetical protein
MMLAYINLSLYQFNTRVWLKLLSGEPGREVTLADILDDELEILVRSK